MKKILLLVVTGMMLLLTGASNGMLGQDDTGAKAKPDLFVNLMMRDISCDNQVSGDKEVKKWLDSQKNKENVKAIYLNKCGITSIKKLGLVRYKNAQILDLSKNKIQQIDVRHLPKQLRQLNLSTNRIQKINLNGLAQLQILNLYYNELKQVDLRSLIQLQQLNCSCNKLQQVDLSKLTQLQQLDLAGNYLQQVDLNQLTELKKLNLTWNKLQQVDLNKLTELKELDLSNNELQQVDLSQLIKLKKLYLSYNQLSYDFVIENLIELESLDLTYINVKNLRLRNLPKLRYLCVFGNKELARLSLLGDVQSVQEITYDRANPDCKIIVEGGRLPNLEILETDHKELFDHISMPLIHKNKVQQEEVLEDKIFLKEKRIAKLDNLLNKKEQKKEEIAALHKKMHSIEAGVAAVLDQPPVNNPEFEAAKKAREQQEQEAREYREKQEQKEDSEV